MRETPRKSLPELTRLQELFTFDAESGFLLWVKSRGTKRAGTVAGSINHDGYFRVGVDGALFMAHRIIWKLTRGDEPPEIVDHIDGNPANNRVENLRGAPPAENALNSRTRSDNQSRIKGVCINSRGGKWRAHLYVKGKQVRLGRFNSIDDARNAVVEARRNIHGSFAKN